MTPIDLIRLQMALAFGAMEMQRRMLGAAWQITLWSMPGAASLPEAGLTTATAGRRRGRE